ncbi:hypothetical protein GXY_00698 [Novacetimonas hansenii ATCC 23769]|uniref:Uncharacterized protein n=1 Tax=Novacetimonas hansenii ATCC 23769 TaxID=714995 RepID=D5QAM0_NOVHA|nr:hypothetical protein GXY_00698 [Novacetimonas hansenii ATCC 23769]
MLKGSTVLGNVEDVAIKHLFIFILAITRFYEDAFKNDFLSFRYL